MNLFAISEGPGGRRSWRRLLLVLVLAGSGGGCDKSAPDPLADTYDLSAIPVSDELRPALSAGLRALVSAEPTGKAVDDFAAYRDLEARISRPEERQAAGAELFARWRTEPTNFLWVELATKKWRELKQDCDFASMWSDPALADTSQGAGAFLLGLRNVKHGGHRPHYLAARKATPALRATDRAVLNIRLALMHFFDGAPLDALELLLAELPEARASGGSLIEADFWRQISGCLQKEDRLDDALHAVVLSIAMWKKVDCPDRALDARRKLVAILESRGEYAGADAVLQAGLRDARAQNHPWALSRLLNDASASCSEVGEWERALRYDLEGLELRRAANDSLSVPRFMVNVADNLRALNRLEECRAYLDSARVWVQAYGDPRNLRRLPMQEVPYYLRIGDYAKVRSLLREALGQLSEGALALEEAAIHLEQIAFALELGEHDLAYRSLARLQVLQNVLHDRLPDSNRLADFEMASAELLARQGEYRLAAAALERATAAVHRGGGESKDYELSRAKGELALMRGDADSAGFYFKHCHTLAVASGRAPLEADSRFLLGLHHLNAGRPVQARRVFDTERSASAYGARFRTRLATQIYRAVTYTCEGQLAAALEGFRLAEKACNPHTPPDLLARLQLEKGRALVLSGQPEQALDSFLKARRTLAAAGLGPASAELRLANRKINRELTELLIGLHVDHPNLVGIDAVPRRTLEIAAAEENQGAGLSQVESGRRFSADLTSAGPWLVFQLGEERSFRWLIGDGTVGLTELPGRKDLLAAVTAVVIDIQRPQRPVGAAALRELSGLLLSGVEDVWPHGAILRITPDAFLCAVPWGLLPVTDPQRPGQVVSALERGAICEEPRLNAAPRPPASTRRAADRSPGSLLVFGNDRPLGDPSAKADPSRLLHAESEARAVAALWPDARLDLRLGTERGTVQLTDLPDFDAIHLAAHTQSSQGMSLRATLRLATPDADLPFTASGLGKLSLKAELIFLSCCEAARPLGPDGDGLNSLARACLTAGARTVIASGQLVDDESAGELARRFYANWLAGAGKAEALRRAQLELRTARPDWAHPYYWASYRLMGDPN